MSLYTNKETSAVVHGLLTLLFCTMVGELTYIMQDLSPSLAAFVTEMQELPASPGHFLTDPCQFTFLQVSLKLL